MLFRTPRLDLREVTEEDLTHPDFAIQREAWRTPASRQASFA